MNFFWSVQLLAEEAAQPDAILRRLLQRTRHAHGPLARANHHHVMRRREFTAHYTHYPAGGQSEQQQKDPCIAREQEHEKTAQVQAEYELEHYQAQGAVRALPGCIAQDQARIARVELFVYLQPEPD